MMGIMKLSDLVLTNGDRIVTVPLIILSKNIKNKIVLNSDKHYSQIEIFPTILKYFGYPKSIYTQYGNTLFEGIDKNIKRKYYITGTGKINIYDK